MNSIPGRLKILGFPVDPVDMGGALAACGSFLAGEASRHVITANPLMLLSARETPGLAAAFHAAALVVPDGAGLQAASFLRGRPLTRVPGIDLMEALCAQAAAAGRSVFLLGAAPGVADETARALLGRHPALRIAGVPHGAFNPLSDETARAVAEARPDILFVALSTPLQDVWIHQNLPRLGVKIAMGVGGSFDVLSGRLRRAPLWMRRVGLEWLFRLLQEPARLRRMSRLPVFLGRALLSRG